MKKYLALILAMLMLLSAVLGLVACGDPDKQDQGGTQVGGGDGSQDDGERIPLELPDVNYKTGGEDTPYHILEWTANGIVDLAHSWIPWEEGDVEEEDGDMLGAAVFDRNAWVEQEYGVEITKEYVSVDANYADNYITRVRNDSSTSSNQYQLFTQRMVNVVSLIQEDLFFDLNTYAGTILHTDQPWWVQDSVASLTLGSHLYVAATEMLLRDKGATAALYFNQDLAADYAEDLPDFFELVDDMEWTFEIMLDACEIVASSTDGDMDMNSAEDTWGCIGGDDPVYYLFNAAGYKFAHVDEFGYIEYDYGEGDSIVTMQTIFEDFMYADWYLNAGVNGKEIMEEDQDLFVDGQVLFRSGMVKDTTNKFKVMEDLYGILPHPLFSVDQENYSSLVWMHHDSVVGIPAHAKDPEMCAVILEALSWESYYRVHPVFYDTILLNRAAKDPDSKRMLQIIFATRSYDPGQFYDTGSNESGLHGEFGLLRLSATYSAEIASMWADYQPLVEANIAEVNRWVAGREE